MPSRTRIEQLDGVLVVGGGFAGVHAATQVRRRGVPCTIVDPTGVHGVVTRFAAVAGGTAPARDAAIPLRAFGVDVRRARVAQVEDGTVGLQDGTTLTADAVVVAAGSRTISPAIERLDRARRLRTSRDALSLRAELATCESVVVVGGGPTGAQLAGAVRSTRPELPVTLIDAGDALLGAFHADLGRHAQRVLERRGVDVRLGTALSAVTDRGLVTDDGSELDGVVVWAGGFESAVDTLGSAIPLDDGSIAVDDGALVDGWSRTFAAGDVAAHRDPDGQRQPMSAQIAVQAGALAGANAARVAKGRDVQSGSLSHRGWVLDLGGWQGVAELGPIRLAAPGLDRIPPLLHAAIDWKNLVDASGPSGLRHAPGLSVAGREALEQLRRLGATDPLGAVA